MSQYITNYEEAAEYLCRIPRFNSNSSLENVKALLAAMGHPEQKMHIVHVAGTNGKGSVCAYLAGLLKAAGVNTGLFTSPHLSDVRERFQINGEMISGQDFTEAVSEVVRLMERERFAPCQFQVYFLVGMYLFAKKNVQVLVLETGLGGRFDATNAVSRKAVTLITHIDLDHTDILGNTLEAIAGEKAGIMMSRVPVIVAGNNEAVAHVFTKKAGELGSGCRILGKADYGCQRVSEKAVAFSYFSRYYGTIPVVLHTQGIYQADNVSLALAAWEELIAQGIVSREALTLEKLQKALYETKWPGRMEEKLPGVFLDGAHNPDGIGAFLKSVPGDGCMGRRLLIFSAVSDKDYPAMLDAIIDCGLFDQIIVTRMEGERGVNAGALYDCIAQRAVCAVCLPQLEQAIAYAFTKRQQLDYIYIVGSLYLVGQAGKILDNQVSIFCKERGEPI